MSKPPSGEGTIRRTAESDRAARSGESAGKTYKWSRTATLFHNCMEHVKGIRGPVGGGKSSTCCWEIRYQAEKMPADPKDGVRRSKWLVVRSSFQQLKRSTISTWLQWFPQTKMSWSSPCIGVLREPSLRNDGTEVEIQLVFYGVKRQEQMEGLRGIELSGAWLNEACDLREDLLDWVDGRCGRYPAKREGEYEPVKLGILMDTNSPSETNWYYTLAEVKKPDGMAFFSQPPAVLRRDDGHGGFRYEPNEGQDPGIPPAENIENLAEGFEYYMKQTRTGRHDYIKTNLMNEYGAVQAGMPIYPEYVDSVNYVPETLEPFWGLPIFMGTDYGRTPACVIGQMLRNGQIVVYDEIVTKGMSVKEFVETVVRPRLVTKFKFGQGSVRIQNFGDPAGANPNETDAYGVIAKMNEFGIPTKPAMPRNMNNSFLLRREAVAESLRMRVSEREPGLKITRPCKTLRSGFLGEYCYRRLAAGDERYADRPDKENPFGHVQDALQYMVYGILHPDGEDPYSLKGQRDLGKLWLPRSAEGSVQTAGLNIAGFV